MIATKTTYAMGMLALASALTVLGCGVHAIDPCRCTAVAAAATLTPQPGSALVIVMHPGHTAGSVNVLDEQGQPLGAVAQAELVALNVAPGTHAFYVNMGGAAYARNGNFNDMAEITVEAGHTYYLTATTNPVAIRTITPASRDDRWTQRQTWLGSCHAVEYIPSPESGRYFGDTQQMVATARQRFDRYDEAHHAEHVASPADAD
jgi:hypothetical protein